MRRPRTPTATTVDPSTAAANPPGWSGAGTTPATWPSRMTWIVLASSSPTNTVRDQLLLLARLDQGRPLERAPVDLARVLADAVRDARAVEPERPIALDAPEHLVVEGDESRLTQVVANLLANARVHTPPGTPVRARLAVEADRAVLEVADEGPGLGPDPARVFERFYRADD